MDLDREHLRWLVEAALVTREHELTCDESATLMDRYLEVALAATPIPTELLGVAEHLVICPECAEEFDAMMRALKADFRREDEPRQPPSP